MKLFLSPHNDDAVLFGFFTLARYQPTVVTVFDSYIQTTIAQTETRKAAVGWRERRIEDSKALAHAGCSGSFLGVRDDLPKELAEIQARHAMRRWASCFEPDEVWAPAVEWEGHDQHNIVGMIAEELWPGKVTHYLTYVRGKGKSRSKNEVLPAYPKALIGKHAALACYVSQIEITECGCWPWFMEDLREYYV